MTSRVSQDIDLRQGFVRSLEERREPGAAEVYERLQEMLGRAESWNGAIRLERLKQAVYRVQVGDGSGRALVLKRHPPAIAQIDRLVAERWLPVLGFKDRCPQLLAAAAEREGRWGSLESFVFDSFYRNARWVVAFSPPADPPKGKVLATVPYRPTQRVVAFSR